MKMGHVTGHKRERTGTTPQFDAIQEAWLRKLEAEWEAQHQTQQAGTK
jgi:hypothetical protein